MSLFYRCANHLGKLGEPRFLNSLMLIQGGYRRVGKTEVVSLEKQASEVRLATGRIVTVAKQPGRYAVLMGKEWYSAFDNDCPVSEGQEVAIAYVEKGRFRNILAVEVLKNTAAKLSDTVPRGFGPSEREAFVARCVALKAAAMFYADRGVDLAGLGKAAEGLAKWLLGSLGAEHQEKASTESNEQKAGIVGG